MTQGHLPFHTYRVYLQGENAGDSVWFLKPQVPAAVDDLVIKDKWEQLARVVNAAANISKLHGRAEGVLRYLDCRTGTKSSSPPHLGTQTRGVL